MKYPGHLLIISCIATFVVVFALSYTWFAYLEWSTAIFDHAVSVDAGRAMPIHKPVERFSQIYILTFIRAIIVAVLLTFLQSRLLSRSVGLVRVMYLGLLGLLLVVVLTLFCLDNGMAFP